MTDKEKLEAIKAELHRLKEVRGVYKDIFNDIFTFINSLPEEPKIDLKEESDIYNALAKFIGSFSKRDFDIAKHFYELGHTEEPVSEIWHNTNEKPNYVEGDTYANSILAFGNTKLGYGASVCNMIDKDTIYAPISKKEYEWNKCPFTMWAYIRDLLLKREEPVSEDFEQPKEQSKDIHTLFDLAAKALFDIASLLPTAEGKEKDVVENIRLICQDYGFKGMMIRGEPVSEDLGEIVLEGTNFNKSWYAHPELAFKAGAKWQKNHIWHDASEEPEDGKELLVLTKGNSIKSVKSYTIENYKNEFYDIIWWKLSEQKAWCYLSDVLPKED